MVEPNHFRQSHCPPGSALAENWSQELELGALTWNADVLIDVFITRPNAHHQSVSSVLLTITALMPPASPLLVMMQIWLRGRVSQLCPDVLSTLNPVTHRMHSLNNSHLLLSDLYWESNAGSYWMRAFRVRYYKRSSAQLKKPVPAEQSVCSYLFGGLNVAFC